MTRAWPRMRATLTAILLALGVLAITSVDPTEAAWTRDQQAAGSFAAVKLLPPTTPVCLKQSSTFRFTWTAPTGMPAGISYSWLVRNGLGIAQTGNTSDLFVDVSPGLLSIGTYEFIVTTQISTWTSSPAPSAKFTLLTSILLSYCGQ